MYENLTAKELASRIKPKSIPGDEQRAGLIDNIKQVFGVNCIKEETRKFQKANIIVFEVNGIENILLFHYGRLMGDKGFFGSDIEYVDIIVDFINNNKSRKIYSFMLFMLGLQNDIIKYFAIPIFFIKNRQSDISKTKGDKYVPQFRFNIVQKNNKFYLRLARNQYEDLSNYTIKITDLLNEKLLKNHDLEKEKYFSIKKDKEELLKKLVKYDQ